MHLVRVRARARVKARAKVRDRVRVRGQRETSVPQQVVTNTARRAPSPGRSGQG